MPFPFLHVCDLLVEIEKAHRSKKSQPDTQASILAKWFRKHRAVIDRPSTDIPALFSTLLPEKRTDRVYGIQAATLHKIVGRAFGLGISRLAQLRSYEQSENGSDLADCVARILTETPSPLHYAEKPVTVEEIDSLLHALASTYRFSSAAVRSSRSAANPVDMNDLGFLYLRLNPLEAKWLTRLVLKAYGVAAPDPALVYKFYDSRLPVILQIQDNFDMALESLREFRSANPLNLGNVLHYVKPVLGTKVGRQQWLTGRSIKHCVDMSPSRISCEKKMDGEYCQVHVDLSKGRHCIQIFSKSAKDSTQDRASLHPAIRDSLRLGRESPAITKGCILEGEMVVYNDRKQKVLPFDKIRKYVTRSGHFIGVDQDSPTDDDEHLMIVYFDALLIDNESLLGLPQTERFSRLQKLVTCRTGHAEIVQRQIIDFDQRMGVSHLRNAFARCIVARAEGLVLKPNEPYFNLGGAQQRRFACCPIKLKKGYVQGFGDVGDFAVIGARYDPVKARSYRLEGIKWTHFFLGCLTNKEAIQAHQDKPCFTVIDSVELNESQLETFMRYANPMPVAADDSNRILDLEIPRRIVSGQGPTVVFSNPPVFDIRCFSFHKPGNTGFWTPRFPQVSKVHYDRDFMDTVTFPELQRIADSCNSTGNPADSQEMQDWIAMLEAADPRGRAVDASSQLTASSVMTPSPRTASTRQSQPSSFSPCESPTKARMRVVVHDDSQHPRSQPLPSLTAQRLRAAVTLDPESPNLLPTPSTSKGYTPSSKQNAQSVSAPASANKRQKIHATQSPTLNRSQKSRSADCSQSQSREPLSAISSNTSPVAERHCATQISSSAPASEKRRRATARTPPTTAPNQPMSVEAVNSSGTTKAMSHQCRLAGNKCLLRNRDILLSPCVAGQLLITEDLLPAHGITSWITDPQTWAQGPPPAVDTATSEQSVPGPRRIKVCFVEGVRAAATRAFIDLIEALDLRLANGEREYVEIYDWRGLQATDQYEKMHRGARPEGKRPLMGSFIGLAGRDHKGLD